MNARISSDGHVVTTLPVIFTIPCRIDARLFPFDTQSCKSRFGVWEHPLEEVTFILQDQDAWEVSIDSYFVGDGVWDLVNISLQNEVSNFASSNYSEISVTLVISRRYLFYVLNVIMPCGLFSLINLMVFILPTESGEKISLGITDLLALTLSQEVIAGIMPPTSDKSPLICKYTSIKNVFLQAKYVGMICFVCLF